MDEELGPGGLQYIRYDNQHAGSQRLSFVSKRDIQIEQSTSAACLIIETQMEVDSLYMRAQIGRLTCDLPGQVARSLLPPAAGVQPELLCIRNTKCGLDIGIDLPNTLVLMLMVRVGDESHFALPEYSVPVRYQLYGLQRPFRQVYHRCDLSLA